MKTTCLIFLSTILISFSACRKDAQTNVLNNSNFSDAKTNGPVKQPGIVQSATTKTQFIANAGGDGTAQITYSFASKNTEVQIIEFDFLAYESDSNDALSIIEEPFATQPFLFHPTAKHGSAKASATIQGDGDVDGPGLYLHADGQPIPVTFTIHYNIPSASGKVKSGDTISIQLLGIGYGPEDKYEEFSLPLSPQIKLTGTKPFLGLNIYDPDQLHNGLTRIFETEYDSQGGSLGINNLPLVIETIGDVQFKKNLVVKDENNNMIDVTTIKTGKNYTIQFPAGYHLNGANVHDFFVYADVTSINGQSSINTSLQPASKFSWTDIAGGRTAPYTIENADYYYNYPGGLVTVTHN